MKALLAVLALTCCASATPRPIFAGMPPERMWGDSAAIVIYASDVEQWCGHTPGQRTYACVRRIKGTLVTILPNPCIYGLNNEMFATLACHEAAHYSHGWSADHEE